VPTAWVLDHENESHNGVAPSPGKTS